MNSEFIDYLDYLNEMSQGSLELAHAFLNSQKNPVWSKWFNYENLKSNPFQLNKCNNRTILRNEIVLDLEQPELYENLISEVKKYFSFYSVYRTGSKGYHIHLFFKSSIDRIVKEAVINYFGCDIQKSYDRCMIALENTPHWKTGKEKTLIEHVQGLNENKVLLQFEDLAKEIKEKLTPWSIQDYENFKPDKNFIIQDFLYHNEITMIYGASGSYKSFILLFLALCVASGKNFLRFKTKVNAVLILSAENPIQIDKERIKMIMKGLKMRKKTIPLYILPRSLCDDIMSFGYQELIFDLIKSKNIRVLILDTINPVTPLIDDNKVRDVTEVFNKFLKKVCDEFNCSVIMAHHTDKQGRQFIGSMKWKANSENVYRIERGENLSRNLKIYNEKNRSGEFSTLELELIFNEKTINFSLIGESKPEIFKKCGRKPNKSNLLKSKLQTILKNNPLKRAEIIQILEKENFEFTNPTLDRVLKKDFLKLNDGNYFLKQFKLENKTK